MLSLNIYIYISLPASRPWAKDFNTADPCGYKSYYRNKGQGPFMAAPGGHPELVDPKEFIVVRQKTGSLDMGVSENRLNP